MQLPTPFRAAFGVVAIATDVVQNFPDKAIELPMLAVSTALQMSLRAQQRYAELAARGDALLAGRASATNHRPGRPSTTPVDGRTTTRPPPRAVARSSTLSATTSRRASPRGPSGNLRRTPVPVRVVALRIGEWIARLGEIWVEGQIAQLTRRPGVSTQFLVLRDPDANISLTVTCPARCSTDAVIEGSRVVLRARPDFYLERGTLSLRATEIRQVGPRRTARPAGAAQAHARGRRAVRRRRKRPLPFLPGASG